MRFLAAVLLAASAPSASLAQNVSAPQMASATTARDINGFQLGMNISEVRSRMNLEHLGFETFTGTHEGVEYAFGFTPQGRLFRIQSSQRLGRFEPDRQFARNLSGRLIQKYGPPARSHLPTGTAEWELIQPVTRADGQRVPFRTMWFTVMVGTDMDGTTLDMTMLDFRLLWADQEANNREPARRGTEAIRF